MNSLEENVPDSISYAGRYYRDLTFKPEFWKNTPGQSIFPSSNLFVWNPHEEDKEKFDNGYLQMGRGYYDAQRIGAKLDYGRYRGSKSDIKWYVALAGDKRDESKMKASGYHDPQKEDLVAKPDSHDKKYRICEDVNVEKGKNCLLKWYQHAGPLLLVSLPEMREGVELHFNEYGVRMKVVKKGKLYLTLFAIIFLLYNILTRNDIRDDDKKDSLAL